ncbi:AfsR/SARP family transcriptional regulator [Allorhizocola rhizosphaerae]|uniref:AfsR/SARP family transcriptional regulator n=1 Tax=Allorhizocola rhizosphaerae TaxID=1872709 RepID=UPI0013C33A64|nr:BTAD domain-containing putative transcriptional regulator [Allorhizocola rhizosphaerae]
MRFEILGPVVVRAEGRLVPIGRPRQRATLAYLLLHSNRVISVETLAEALWGGAAPATARSQIQADISALRKALRTIGGDGVIGSHPAGYLADVDGVAGAQLDYREFDRLVAQARAVDQPELAASLLRQALGLWQTTPLADATAAYVPGMRAHMEAQRLAAYERLAEVELELGRHADLAAELPSVVAAHPTRERLRAALMLALYRCGRRADALALARDLRTWLAEEHGLDPDRVITDLERQILQDDPAIAFTSNHHLVPAQLPADVATFTGRDRYLKQLDELMRAGPAAVVISAVAGAAGVGKTALAVHWAHSVRDRFPDGQLYADLRGFTPRTPPLRPIDVLARFLRALGVPDPVIPTELDAAAAMFRTVTADRHMLILLDNARDADQVRPLLPGGPGCLVLVTSRDRLAGLVAQEGAVPVRLGALTSEESASLLAELLGPETASAQPDTVARLARLCGHLPLALRIAAANLSTRPGITLDEYVAALSTGNRLAELAFAEDPQAGVAATFDLSYTALPAPAARLFRLIGLAPCHDVDAAAVAALGGITTVEAVGLLGLLTAAHLLDEPAYGRYTCHDLLRHYAASLALGQSSPAGSSPAGSSPAGSSPAGSSPAGSEKDEALTRLYAYYMSHADAATELQYCETLRLLDPADFPTTEASFPDKQTAASWLKTEARNLFAVINHTAEHGPRRASWLLADAMRGYFWLHPETVDLLAIAETALRAAEADCDLRGQAACHRSLGTIHRTLTHFDEAIRRHRLAIAFSRQAGWTDGEVAALDGLATVYWQRNEFGRTLLPFRRALRLSRGERHWWNVAVLLHNLATIHYGLGDLRASHDCLTEALTLRRRLGSRCGEAFALNELAEREHQLGRPETALELLAAAMPIHEEMRDLRGQNMVLRRRAAVHRDMGRLDRALDDARAAVALASTLDHLWENAHAIHTLGTVENVAGYPSRAVELLQQALQMARDMGTQHFEAQVRIGLGEGYRGLGRPAEAAAQLSQALTISVERGFRLLEIRARDLLQDRV